MKKLVLLFLLTAAAAGMLSAQTTTPVTTIQGTIGLVNGNMAVTGGTITYYVKGLERYISFIDALKAGAQVTLEGYAAAPSVEGQTYRYFYPVKLTINGIAYQVGSAGDPAARGRGEGSRRR